MECWINYEKVQSFKKDHLRAAIVSGIHENNMLQIYYEAASGY